LVSTIFVLLEWARVAAQDRRAQERADAGVDSQARTAEALGETGQPAR
jgi:hypothetical protein